MAQVSDEDSNTSSEEEATKFNSEAQIGLFCEVFFFSVNTLTSGAIVLFVTASAQTCGFLVYSVSQIWGVVA